MQIFLKRERARPLLNIKPDRNESTLYFLNYYTVVCNTKYCHSLVGIALVVDV